MFKFVIIASLVAYAQAYSSGAPEESCQDMIPRHPVSAQTSPSPYTITTSTKTVKAGTPMEVVISGQTGKDKIGGMLLQARHGDNIIGTFAVPADDKFAKTLNCGANNNAVTHKKHDASAESQTVKYTWTPPKDFNGEIKFRSTVARNGAVFWVGVESAPVKVTA